MVNKPNDNYASRLWRKDVSLWESCPPESISPWLGWVDSVAWMKPHVDGLCEWAEKIVSSGRYSRAILLGMGGSSLAAAVSASLFEQSNGYLPLTVVDTTHPEVIAQTDPNDLEDCLIIVASKSGNTVETADLYEFFYRRLDRQCADKSRLQSNFVVITDQNSPLHKLAKKRRCENIFINPDDVGGRYSALTYFGMLPCALVGGDVKEIICRAEAFCTLAQSDNPEANPALALGMRLGQGALAGRDKLMLYLPEQLRVFGLWIEQLVAESTGKDGKGIVPVLLEGMHGDRYTDTADRVKIRYYDPAGDKAEEARTLSADLLLPFNEPTQIGVEYLRWQIATAIAAVYLKVNPFDQPDVVRSKRKTHDFVTQQAQFQSPAYCGKDFDLYYSTEGKQMHGEDDMTAVLEDFYTTLTDNCYVGVLAYLPEAPPIMDALHRLRDKIRQRWEIVTTIGIGPRYLHSTAQLHKGGAARGRFIQIITDTNFPTDEPIANRAYSFVQLYRAQADGDFTALAEMGRTVLRVHLKGDRLHALKSFNSHFG